MIPQYIYIVRLNGSYAIANRCKTILIKCFLTIISLFIKLISDINGRYYEKILKNIMMTMKIVIIEYVIV